MSSPYHNCEKRVLGCHSSCEVYITYAEWARAKNEPRVEIEIAEAD